jgi:hypothetical protein
VTVARWLWWGAIALEGLLTLGDIWMLEAWGVYGFAAFAAQMGLGIAIILVGCVFVPRLRAGHLAPRWVLAAAGAAALGATALDDVLNGGRWIFELVPVLLLLAATVLLFLPQSTRFFRLQPASESGVAVQPEAAVEPEPSAAVGIPADPPSGADR